MKKLLLAIFLVPALHVFSQPVTAGGTYTSYKDIWPDTLLSYQVYPSVYKTYSLNVFGSSAYDLKFTMVGSVSSGGSQAQIKVASLNPDVYIRLGRLDSVWVPANQNWYVTKIAKPLVFGEQINTPDAIWDNTELYISDHTGSGGGNKNVNDFLGGDKYIGLKFIDIDDYNSVSYGWIRINCISEDSCYLKDYSSMARVVGISNNTVSDIRLYPNPTKDKIYLSNLTSTSLESLTISDLYGRSVPFIMSNANDGLVITLDKNLTAGCYVLRCQGNNGVAVKRFIKSE